MQPSVNRRYFIAGSGMTVVSLAGLTLPIALPAPVQSATIASEPAADWSIDDMWTGYPRPWQPIGGGRVASDTGAVLPDDMPPGSIELLFG